MTLEKAKELGVDLLRGLRYGADGYFWADTTEGVNVVLYGQNRRGGAESVGRQGPKGTFYVKEFLAKGKAGGGYVEYWFEEGTNHSATQAILRALFKPFGWVVGSGY